MKLININSLLVLIIIFIMQTAESKMNLQQMMNMLKPIKTTCIKKNSVDLEIVDNTKQGIFVDDPALKCYFKCVLQMLKVIKDGDLDLNSFLQQLDLLVIEEYSDRIKETVLKCQKTASEGDNICHKAFLFIKCYYETDPEMYFMP